MDILSINPYEKMCMVKELHFFSIIHNCPTSLYLRSTMVSKYVDWKMANKTVTD